MSLERGLDGRALPIEVRAGNVFFLDPATGQFPPFAPIARATPSRASSCPGAGASGINIIDNALQNPQVQQCNLGVADALAGRTWSLRVDGLHNHGTHFIIGRPVGTVFNPVVGGPDRVVNLESSVGTQLRRPPRLRGEARGRAAPVPRLLHPGQGATTTRTTTRSRSRTARSTRTTSSEEYGPTPNDQRHRFTFAGSFALPWRLPPLAALDAGLGRARWTS